MSLAADIGIDIPEIRLLTTDKLDGLAGLSLPSEPHAYAIRRFDRLDGERIHSEDFAQILNLYPNDKYDKANYEMIGRLLYQYSDSPLIDLQQFARRLLANILLANGDAHLKNWSLHYPQQRQVRLAPAYDLVATLVYIPTETGMALKLGNRRKWADLSFDSFQRWCERIGAPWPAIRIHLYDAIMAARERWPKLLETLPMIDSHKAVLQQHWRTLPEDFRIQC